MAGADEGARGTLRAHGASSSRRCGGSSGHWAGERTGEVAEAGGRGGGAGRGGADGDAAVAATAARGQPTGQGGAGTNLPQALTSFVGRESEVAEVRAALTGRGW